MNSLKTRFHLRAILSVFLSLSLVWGSLSPLAWGAGVEINGGGENFKGTEIGVVPSDPAFLESQTPLIIEEGDQLKIEGGAGISPISLKAEEKLEKPTTVQNVSESSKKKKQRKLDSKGKNFRSFKKGFEKIQKGVRKALAGNHFSASKNFIDRFFGEKSAAGKLADLGEIKAESAFNARLNILEKKGSFQNSINPPNPVPEIQNADPYGGPSYKKMSLGGQILYGLKWGLIMEGVTHAIVRASYFVSGSHWFQALAQARILHLSPAALQSHGYGALLIFEGPKRILYGDFSYLSLLTQSAAEEIIFRGAVFGGLFLAAVFAAPTLGFAGEKLKALPDFFAVMKDRLPELLKSSGKKITQNAFLTAAAASSILFALAHIPAWGTNPLFLIQQLVAGLALAFVVYRTRSLAAPISAHYAFNFTWIFGIFLPAATAPIHYGYQFYLNAAALLVIGRQIYKSLWPALKSSPHAAIKDWIVRLKKAARGIALPAAALMALLMASLLGISVRDLRANSPAQMPNASLTAPSAVLSAPIQKFSLPETPSALPDLSPEQIIARARPAVIKVHAIGQPGLGTGYLITPSGIALTNAHVAGNAAPGDTLHILVEGIPSEAEVLAIDHKKDIAILRLPELPQGQSYPFLPISRKTPAIGEKVVALGYPYDVGLTATRGIVSRLGHDAKFMYDYVQTDASINPGNSGGPLLNSKGELIGMDVAIYTPSNPGGSVGIGFAIATDDILDAVSEYQENGTLEFAHLGVIVAARSNSQGVVVEAVRPGSAAQKANILPGDQIKKIALMPINGLPMVINTSNFQSLERALVHLRPGDPAALIVRRGNRMITLRVVFGE